MKPIRYKNISNFYYIDKNGAIINIKRGKKKKTYLDKDGYEKVTLYDENKKRINIAVHRLVAYTYLGEPPIGKPMVNHKDGIRTNNSVSNLEWVNDEENKYHSKTEGAFFKKKKKVYLLVEIICQYLEAGLDTTAIMEQLGIYGAKSNPRYLYVVKIISAIRRGTSFTHISSKYNIDQGSTTSKSDNEYILTIRIGEKSV